LLSPSPTFTKPRCASSKRLSIPKTPKASKTLEFCDSPARSVPLGCNNACVGSSQWLPADCPAGRPGELENLPLRQSAARSPPPAPASTPAVRDRSAALDLLYRIWPRPGMLADICLKIFGILSHMVFHISLVPSPVDLAASKCLQTQISIPRFGDRNHPPVDNNHAVGSNPIALYDR
jgi:hypothetical protein